MLRKWRSIVILCLAAACVIAIASPLKRTLVRWADRNVWYEFAAQGTILYYGRSAREDKHALTIDEGEQRGCMIAKSILVTDLLAPFEGLLIPGTAFTKQQGSYDCTVGGKIITVKWRWTGRDK